jgi:hypothetical protein
MRKQQHIQVQSTQKTSLSLQINITTFTVVVHFVQFNIVLSYPANIYVAEMFYQILYFNLHTFYFFISLQIFVIKNSCMINIRNNVTVGYGKDTLFFIYI